MHFREFLIQLLLNNKIQGQIEELDEIIGFDGLYLKGWEIIFLMKDESICQKGLKMLESYCVNHQIRFIQINKEELVERRVLLENRILSLFKIRNRIHGRLCRVEKINKFDADAFLKKNHSLGSTGAPNRYGLFFENTLFAVACFSKPRIMTYEDVPYYSFVWERYASVSDTTVIGGMSKLLNAFMKDSGAKHIMTYADLNWGTGNAFKKLGFKEITSKEFNLSSNEKETGNKIASSMKYILDLR